MSETASAEGVGGKFLTFKLDGEEYGLEILAVQEIIGLMAITSVPRTPEFLRGVINLRGRVIPVVDLRVKFGLPAVPPTPKTCIIVVRAHDTETGLIVDAVADVRDLPDESIAPAPRLGAGVRHELILGLGKADDGVKILLDIERALSIDDVVELRRAETSA